MSLALGEVAQHEPCFRSPWQIGRGEDGPYVCSYFEVVRREGVYVQAGEAGAGLRDVDGLGSEEDGLFYIGGDE